MKRNEKLVLLREIFERKFLLNSLQKEKIAALDAFLQFAQNPTSMSAGYGVEENYPFIGRNLYERYGRGKIALDMIISFLKRVC